MSWIELIISLAPNILIWVPGLWISHKIKKVSEFRSHIIDMGNEYRKICYQLDMDCEVFFMRDKMPSFNKMIFSTKPLEVKYWLNEKDLKRIDYMVNAYKTQTINVNTFVSLHVTTIKPINLHCLN